jgi:hypothetical protein
MSSIIYNNNIIMIVSILVMNSKPFSPYAVAVAVAEHNLETFC